MLPRLFALLHAQDRHPAINPSAATEQPARGPDQLLSERTPPDQKARTEASKITDPAKKTMPEKPAKDFPDGMFASIADASILSTRDVDA